jgi:small-conductance mechanosensitive channel
MLRKKPFRIGDHIRIGEEEGKVLHIGTFYVLLDKTTQLPEDYTRVPNRLFLEKSILNLGKTHYHDEILFPCTEIPAEKNQLMKELRTALEGLAADKDNLAVYYDIRNEKLVLVVEYLSGFENRQAVRSKVIEATVQRFGPYLAFPK